MGSGTYAALFSGGKDSYLALQLAREAGHEIDRLVTVDAPTGSYLYHVPATAATKTIATAIGLPLERIALAETVAGPTSSTAAATAEANPLADWLDDRLAADDPPLAGLVTGAVASRYQYDLLSTLCDERHLELVAPLWGWTGEAVLDAVCDRGVAADIVAVAADGLDQSWLGRRLDAAAVAELVSLADRRGVHPAGEGGEFETLVVDGPDFDAPVAYDADAVWDGTRGHLRLEQVGLADGER